jgi:hypothetical protein
MQRQTNQLASMMLRSQRSGLRVMILYSYMEYLTRKESSSPRRNLTASSGIASRILRPKSTERGGFQGSGVARR